jgi:Cof subfamily protein (haloacid dehalogenase superfamily)
MPTVHRDRYDALVLDLDGTLLDGQGRVTPRTREEVTRLCDRGWIVLLATGRSLAGTRDVHAELGLDTDVVCYNGAWIGRRDGSCPWHYAPIPDDLLGEVAGVESRAEFLFRHQGDAKYTTRTGHPHHPRVTNWYVNAVVVEPPPAGALPDRDLLRVSLFFEGAHHSDAAWSSLSGPARERLHREVFPMSIFPEFADVGLVLCEVQRRGLGKAEALRYLRERHGVPAERVIAVGDQANDLPLLREAGLAVAMGNAIPEAREVADVVIGDHREEGVARWIAAEVG